MNNLRALFVSAAILAAVSFGILQGHALLTRFLAERLLHGVVPDALRFATVGASLIVHLVAGIWVLPGVLRSASRQRVLREHAVRLMTRVSLAVMFLRAGFEALSGVVVVGLPVLGMAAATTCIALLGNWPARARVALRMLRGAAAKPGAHRRAS